MTTYTFPQISATSSALTITAISRPSPQKSKPVSEVETLNPLLRLGVDVGKLVLAALGNELQASAFFWIRKSTPGVTFTDGSVTESIAGRTFRGARSLLALERNVVTLTQDLRRILFCEERLSRHCELDRLGGTRANGVKFRVHFLSRRRDWKAGDEIPDEDVPPNIRKYAATVWKRR